MQQGEPRLELAGTARPATVAVGDELTVTVTAANSGDASALGTVLEVRLPDELRLIRASASTEEADGTTFDLQTLAPGEEKTVTLTLQAARVTRAAGAGIELEVRSGAQARSASVTVHVTEEETRGLEITSDSDGLLAQVDDRVEYRLEVTNTSDSRQREVVVTDVVAAELTIASVPQVGEFDAVAWGSHLGRQDIVWVINSLAPGGSSTLRWSGQVTKTGDFEAINSVRAKARGIGPVSSENSTFLGAAGSFQTDNPPFTPIVTKKVVTRPVTVSVAVPTAAVAAVAAPGTLPVTGIDPWSLVGGGLALIATGSILWSATSGDARRRRVPGALVVVALLLSACTGAGPERAQEARVKGERIESNDPNGEAQGGGGGQDEDATSPGGDGNGGQGTGGDGNGGQGTGGGEDEAAGDPGPGAEIPPGSPSPAPPAPGIAAPAPGETTTTVAFTRLVTEVRRVTVDLDDLSIATLESRPADNSMSYEWDHASRTILGATSSIRLRPGRTVALVTSLGSKAGTVDVTVTLTNEAPGRRLAVRGRLVHEVTGTGGTKERFESERIDEVLAPGGSTSATFTYLVPSGRYSATASFAAS